VGNHYGDTVSASATEFENVNATRPHRPRLALKVPNLGKLTRQRFDSVSGVFIGKNHITAPMVP
jgi:hypothetical protein